jgi:hypothetical protein
VVRDARSGCHAEWLHTIGNLTLTGYNPELGNRSYAEKWTTFALSHFELNRYFGNQERWGPNEIENRARELFRVALQLWPRPEMAAFSVDSSIATDRSVQRPFTATVSSWLRNIWVSICRSCLKPDMSRAMVGLD